MANRKIFYKTVFLDAFKVIGSLVLISSINPHAAFAYLDPSSGSMVLQIILASIAGIGCSWGVFKKKVAGFIKKIKNDR